MPPHIDLQPWEVLEIDGQRYGVKSLFEDASYEFLVTDFCRIWEEYLTENDIAARAKALNRNVEAPLVTILKCLQNHLESQVISATYEIRKEENDWLTLNVDVMLSRLPFKWCFNCKPSPPNRVADHLTLPLLGVARELVRRQDELVRMLKRKDKEIEDYKLVYGPPSRRNLETALFDDKVFGNEMVISKEFQENSLSCVDFLSTNIKLRDMYCDVAKIRHWSKRPASAGPTPVRAELIATGTTGSWTGRVPTSILPDPIPTSPNKKPKPSPSKESELQRREALKKKLENDAQKNKKKKKKLI